MHQLRLVPSFVFVFSVCCLSISYLSCDNTTGEMEAGPGSLEEVARLERESLAKEAVAIMSPSGRNASSTVPWRAQSLSFSSPDQVSGMTTLPDICCLNNWILSNGDIMLVSSLTAWQGSVQIVELISASPSTPYSWPEDALAMTSLLPSSQSSSVSVSSDVWPITNPASNPCSWVKQEFHGVE